MTTETDTETLSPTEYDTLVELTDRAQRIAKARWRAYTKATGGHTPYRASSDPDSFRFNARGDRLGRDPLGRYDVILTFRDYEGDETDIQVPSALLWDPEGITDMVVAAIAAAEAEAKAKDEAERAERIAADAVARERHERSELRRLAKKHGFALTPPGTRAKRLLATEGSDA